MKTRFLLLMVFSLLLLAGCSIEEEDELLVESFNNELLNDNTRAATVTRPFKVRGSGIFEVVPNTDCGAGLTQILIQGEGNATHLGMFSVEIVHCTNFFDVFEFTGVQTAANGDELHFYSVGFGVDEEGQWTEYVYDGGTGRFEYATGELRLYGENEFTGPTTGVYNNWGYGTLTY